MSGAVEPLRAAVLAACLAVAAPLAWAAPVDPATVPVSAAAIPPFPVVQLPKEVAKATNQQATGWDRVYVLAGERLQPVEGRYLRRMFLVQSAGLSAEKVMQHYAREIAALGGVRVATLAKGNDAVLGPAGAERERAYRKLRQFESNDVLDQYLIRTPKGNLWIGVSVFDGGLNGSIVVVEEQPFTPSVAPLPG